MGSLGVLAEGFKALSVWVWGSGFMGLGFRGNYGFRACGVVLVMPLFFLTRAAILQLFSKEDYEDIDLEVTCTCHPSKYLRGCSSLLKKVACT